MISPAARHEALTRIRSGQSDAKTEAARLGVSARHVRRWLADRSASFGAEPSPPTPPNVSDCPPMSPPADMSASPPPTPMADVLAAAGLPPDPEPEQAPERDSPGADKPPPDVAGYCVEQIGSAKQLLGGLFVALRYCPPLRGDEPGVEHALELSPTTTLAIRANAERLYPLMIRIMGGNAPLIVALLFDCFVTVRALRACAESRGWKDPGPGKSKQGPSPEVAAAIATGQVAPGAMLDV